MADMTLADGIDLLQRRTKIVKILLVAGFLANLALLIGEIGELNGDILLGNPDPSPKEQLYNIALLAHSGVTLTTFVLFSMWIYRAAANVVVAGVGAFSFTPGWNVGWYFIPFANLVQPFRAMRQIWNASHGDGSDIDRGDPILTLWWTTWLASNMTANISVQLSWRATDLSVYQTSVYFGLASSAISLVLMVVGIRLVEFITAAQRDRLSSAHIFT